MSSFDPNHSSEKAYSRIGAKTIITREDGKILVLRRSQQCDRPGGWDFPGGASNFGEDPKQTAIRETTEETGLEIHSVTLTTIHSYMSNGDHILLVGFVSEYQSREVTLSWEHDLYKWIDPKEAADFDWGDFHKKLLKEYRQQKK